MINLNPYFLSGQFSSASWRWGTGTGGTPNGVSNALSVDAPGDAVWSGITLNAGPTAPDLYDAAARYYDIGGSLLTGVTAVASNPSDSTQLAIAHAAAGSLQTGGGEQYFFATNGGNEPFTADGETAFLNAIDALAPSVVVIPEPSTALLGLVGAAIFLRRRR
ncbi:MAG: PEP-CTERM sorting domain-containing protein [Akkermansiaceae bacterium]